MGPKSFAILSCIHRLSFITIKETHFSSTTGKMRSNVLITPVITGACDAIVTGHAPDDTDNIHLARMTARHKDASSKRNPFLFRWFSF